MFDSSSEDSWETANPEVIDFNLPMRHVIKRKAVKDTRMKILHKILLIFEMLRKPRTCQVFSKDYLKSNFISSHEKVMFFNSKLNSTEVDVLKLIKEMNLVNIEFPGLFGTPHKSIYPQDNLLDLNISHFINLNLNDIASRIYFVVSDVEINIFHEILINKNIVEKKELYNGNCFSIAFNGSIKNQTSIFCKNCAHYKFFDNIINILKSRQSNMNLEIQEFEELDNRRAHLMPSNISKLKTHPLFTAEVLCRDNEFIYPKRPIIGMIKGSPVYNRNNVKKLRSENGWFRMGYFITANTKPYRIVDSKTGNERVKLYSDFQVQELVVDDINKKTMPAFHERHTPTNCVRIAYDSHICKDLGLRHADCLIGFRGKEMIINGFFIEKKYCFLINYFIGQMEYFGHVDEEVDKYESTINEWKILVKKIQKYLRIKERIDA